jgi:hypothetical protein
VGRPMASEWGGTYGRYRTLGLLVLTNPRSAAVPSSASGHPARYRSQTVLYGRCARAAICFRDSPDGVGERGT